MKKILLITTLSLFCISGCQTDNQTKNITSKMTSTDSYQLTETKWQLTQFNGEKIKQNNPQAELPYIILQSKERKVVGLAGCNRFFGSYQSTKNELHFSNFGMTMMACYDLPIEEYKFIEALEKTDNYTKQGSQLTVKQGSKPLAVFQAVAK